MNLEKEFEEIKKKAIETAQLIMQLNQQLTQANQEGLMLEGEGRAIQKLIDVKNKDIAKNGKKEDPKTLSKEAKERLEKEKQVENDRKN